MHNLRPTSSCILHATCNWPIKFSETGACSWSEMTAIIMLACRFRMMTYSKARQIKCKDTASNMAGKWLSNWVRMKTKLNRKNSKKKTMHTQVNHLACLRGTIGILYNTIFILLCSYCMGSMYCLAHMCMYNQQTHIKLQLKCCNESYSVTMVCSSDAYFILWNESVAWLST